MPDEVSTLALRVSSGDAIQNLRAVAHESEALSGITDMLKGKVLSVVSAYASWRFGKILLADAAESQEAFGKFEAVLGSYAEKASKVVDELNAKFNFSKSAAQAALSGMVDTFKKSGVETSAALDWTEDLTKLAADLEAFTNAEGGVQHITEQMSSALLGNNMAVRSLGIVLSAEAVQAQKAKEAMDGLTFSSEQQAEMHARKTLIEQQSAAAMGQVAREADNYSNRLRYLNARLSDLRGSLGEALIPTMTKVVEGAAKITDAINDFSPATKQFVVAGGAMTGAFVAFLPWILKVRAGFKQLSMMKTVETAATQGETAATVEETGAAVAQNSVMGINLKQTEALTVAKNAEALARRQNAKAILVESLASGKGGAIKGAGKLATSAVSTGKLANGAAQAASAGSLVSGATKPIQKFGMEVGKIATTLGTKTPVLKTFGSSLLKIGGAFGSTAAGIGIAITALELFKHAPQWVEVAFEKLPGVFSTIGQKSIEAVMNIGSSAWNWGKNLAVDGLLGAAQTGKRLLGMKTEVTRERELNKQIEANNKKRAELQEIQRKQQAAEQSFLTTQASVKQSKINARLGVNESRESESVKLRKAIEQRDLKSSAITSTEKQLEEVKNAITSGKLSGGQLDEQQEKAKQLAETLTNLNEEWKNATLEVDKLSEAAESAAKSFDDNQKAYQDQRKNARLSIEEAQAQNQLDSANSHRSRQSALQAQRNTAKTRLDEANNAQGEADALNEQAIRLQGQLTNEKAAQALTSLENLAQSGDISDDAGMAYANAKVMLRDAGYGDLVEQNEGFGQGSALQLLEAMTEARKRQQKELDQTLSERDEKQSLANEAGSRLSAYNQSQRAIDEEGKAFSEQQENERRQNEEQARRRERANRAFQQSLSDSYFERQLRASDEYYGNDAYGAAASRYGMIGERGATEWSDSMAALEEQQNRLDELNSTLAELDQKFKEGTLTDDEAKERERLMNQRAALEDEMQSDYQAAIQKRLQTEDSLLGLESTMRQEYLKNVQSYVDEEGNALRERLTAEAELQKKRMEELSKVEEEARQAVSGQRAITSGSSEAFGIASKIYERGRENLPTEKKIENSTKKIEEYVKIMQESMMAYFTEQSGGMTLSFGY